MQLQMLGSFFQDLRLAVRGMRKSPAFTLVAVSSLALGIGANAAIFSFVDAILLKRLPVPDAERLVRVREFEKNKDVNDAFSYPFIQELAKQNQVFDGVSARWPVRVNLTSSGFAEPLNGELVTGQYFETLGVRPARGRLLDEDDIRASVANPVCVISYSAWQERFAADPHIVGRSLLLNSRPYRVIGVTQKGFYGADLQSRIDIQIPVARTGDFMPGFSGSMGITWDSPRFTWLQPLGRLKPGITRTRAEAMLQPLVRQIKFQFASSNDRKLMKLTANGKWTVRLLDGSQGFNIARYKFAQPIGILMGVVGLVLLIACANLANLLLARASTREKEFAVRLSLGASRSRLIRQLMTESLAIAVCGGALGIILSSWIVDTLLVYLNEGRSPLDSLSVSPDPIVIGFSIALSMLAAVIFGLAPAWQSARPDLVTGLREASSGAGAGRDRAMLRKAIIVVQLSLSLVMLFTAGLLTRTLATLETVDLGFKPAKVVALSVDPAMNGYSGAQTNALYDQILNRLRSAPGIAAASITTISPLEGSSITLDIDVPGHIQKNSDIAPVFDIVSPGYFITLNQPFVLGRDFSDYDAKGAQHVAVVNERFAEQYTPGQNPIGRHFKQGGGEVEIVGVVKTARYREIRESPQPVVYYAVKQSQSSGFTMLVRGNTNPTATIAAIGRIVHSIDPKLPIQDVRTLEAQIDQGISPERILGFLSALFSALATLLCGIGLYGIVAYAVSRRTREIGVRFAIGARKSDIASLFLRETIVLIAAGIAIGIPVALASTRVLKSLLYGLDATDLPTLAVTTALLVMAALLATFLPVRRAAAIEPLEALRYE